MDCCLKEISPDKLAGFMRKNSRHPILGQTEFHIWQNTHPFGAYSNDSLVAVGGMLEQRVRPSDEPSKSLSFGVNFVVDRGVHNFVQKECGRLVMRRMLECEDFAGVGMTTDAIKLWRRKGRRIDRSNALFIRPLKPIRTLSFVGSRPNCRHFGGTMLLAPALYLANKVFQPEPPPVKPFIDFQYSAQHLDIETAANHSIKKYGSMMERNRGLVNRKIAHPRNDYALWVVRESDNERAYVLFRDAVPDGDDRIFVKIVDFGGPDRLLAQLLSGVSRYASSRNADAVLCLTSKLDAEMMRKAGLYAYRSYPVMLPNDFPWNPRVTFLDADLDDLW